MQFVARSDGFEDLELETEELILKSKEQKLSSCVRRLMVSHIIANTFQPLHTELGVLVCM